MSHLWRALGLKKVRYVIADKKGYDPRSDVVIGPGFRKSRTSIGGYPGGGFETFLFDMAIADMQIGRTLCVVTIPPHAKTLKVKAGGLESICTDRILCLETHTITPRIIQEFINMGANPSVSNNYAMRQACKYGNVETVRILIRNGAEFTDAAVEKAARANKVDIIKLLLSYYDNSVPLVVGLYKKSLASAIVEGSIDVIRQIIPNNADIEKKAVRDFISAALLEARYYNQSEIYSFLRQYGTPII